MNQRVFYIAFLTMLFCFSLAFASPWGKDADLSVRRVVLPQQKVHKGIGVQLSEMVIAFHQQVISPADGPRSHYKPSSSQYTLDAIRKYGFFKGYLLGCDRLMRENDEEWIYPKIHGDGNFCIKYDPVN